MGFLCLWSLWSRRKNLLNKKNSKILISSSILSTRKISNPNLKSWQTKNPIWINQWLSQPTLRSSFSNKKSRQKDPLRIMTTSSRMRPVISSPSWTILIARPHCWWLLQFAMRRKTQLSSCPWQTNQSWTWRWRLRSHKESNLQSNNCFTMENQSTKTALQSSS